MLSGIKWGGIAALLSFIWLILEMLVGLHDKYIEYHPIITMFALIIPIICLILGMKEARDNSLESLTYWDLFGQGVYITAFFSLLSIFGTYIFLEFVSPDYFDKMKLGAIKMAIKNHYDVDKVKVQANDYFTLKSYLKQVAIGNPIFGIVASLVGAFSIQRKIRMQKPTSAPNNGLKKLKR